MIYTLYWKDGKREIVRSAYRKNAYTKSTRYSPHPRDLVLVVAGNDESYRWNSFRKVWIQVVRSAPQPVVQEDDNGDSFLTSLLVAEMTDNIALGYMAGGNLLGAIIGEEIAESRRETVVDDTPSYDSSSSDSSSSSGSDW